MNTSNQHPTLNARTTGKPVDQQSRYDLYTVRHEDGDPADIRSAAAFGPYYTQADAQREGEALLRGSAWIDRVEIVQDETATIAVIYRPSALPVDLGTGENDGQSDDSDDPTSVDYVPPFQIIPSKSTGHGIAYYKTGH